MRQVVRRACGASAMMSATSENRPGLAWNSENSCTPAGSRDRNWSKRSDRRVGIGGAAEDAQQFRHELGQDLARPLAARRADAAVMPAAHHRRDPRRLAEAEPRQRRQRLRVVLGAGEDEIAGSGEARRLLEQFGIMPLDRAEPGAEFGDERIRVLVAEKRREPRDPGAVGRQAVGLRVLDHLQPVLDAAQKAVMVDQRVAGRGVDAPGRGQRAQAPRRSGRPAARACGRPRSAAASGRKTRSRGCRRGRS